MPNSKLHILIADDDDGDRKLIRRSLNEADFCFECTETDNIQGALAACDSCAFDCAIVDYGLPGQDGLAGVAALHERLPYMAIIMSTGQGDETVAAEAIKRGALDYLPKKHLSAQSLKRSVKVAVEIAKLRKKVDQQRDELENFTRVLVHDFKSPIQSGLGFASLIEHFIAAGQLEQASDYSRRLKRSIDRMALLIDTLNQHTKNDEQVAYERVDLNQVMADVKSDLAHLISERGAQVTASDLPTVHGNAPQLTQLFQNLIGNGIKYSQSETPCVQIAAKPQDEEATWLISVADNGIGIPEKDTKQIFQPFKRLHNHGAYEGTGLGLATCKKIVERHQGEIWCESKAGQGSTFFFTLRRAERPAHEDCEAEISQIQFIPGAELPVAP